LDLSPRRLPQPQQPHNVSTVLSPSSSASGLIPNGTGVHHVGLSDHTIFVTVTQPSPASVPANPVPPSPARAPAPVPVPVTLAESTNVRTPGLFSPAKSCASAPVLPVSKVSSLDASSILLSAKQPQPNDQVVSSFVYECIDC
jgi:hypothetical protein